jgi:ligand-binding sensor domain-containing protein
MNAGYSYYLYIMKGDEWKIYDRSNFKPIPPGGGAEGIVNDKTGNIWLKSGQYIRRLKGENFDKSYYLPDYGFSSGYIISMVFDLNNALWLSISMNNGKYDIIKIVEDTVSFRLSSTDMLSGRKNPKLAIDSMNNVWISTDSGLTKYDGRTFTDYNKSNTIIKVQSHQYLSAGAKYLWVSGTDSTLYKYDYKQNIWHEIKLKRYPDAGINGLVAYKDKAFISRSHFGISIVDSTEFFLVIIRLILI